MEKQCFWHEIYLFMLNSSKNLFEPSYFPKFSNCHTLSIKKSRQWANWKNLISRAWKNSAHALLPESFNSCQGWYRGYFMETRLNFMPGMKSDDIEATVRKRGCISCPAWNRVISRLLHGNEVAFHAGHEIGGNLNFTPGMKISIWLISCLAGHEYRSQPTSCGAWKLVLASSAVENLDVSVGKFIKWRSDCVMQSSWIRFLVTGDLIAIF